MSHLINGDDGKRPRPVLMIPLRRCGSHALRLRLSFNKDFYSPYPLHLVDFMPLVPLYGDLTVDYNYFQLVVDLVGLQNVSMVKWENTVLNPVTIFDTIKERPRSVHAVAWEMLFQAGRQNNARIVMDKSLDNVHYADHLVKLFDDILFLNVVRDPRAQISSMNQAIIHDFDSTLNALTWVKAQEAGRQLAQKYPERVLTIRFEDFIAHQEDVLKGICKFFGMEFMPSMLDVSKSAEAKSISVLSALWESNSSAPIAANVDKFKKSLSMEDIEIIETLTAEYMDFYGYERMTRGKASFDLQRIEASRLASELKRGQAWDKMREAKPQDYQLRRFRVDYLNMIRDRQARAAAGETRKSA